MPSESTIYYRNLSPEGKERRKRQVSIARRLRRTEIRAFFSSYKLRVGCAQCGYREHADALQLDHIEPIGNHLTGNAYERKRMLPSTWAKLNRLLADPNVQILCANCHAIKSASENRENPGAVRYREVADARALEKDDAEQLALVQEIA